MPERLVLADALATQVLGDQNWTVLARFQGDDVRGVHYQALFDGMPAPNQKVDWEQTYRVVTDDFVSLEDGTGIVHIAPAYGDLEIGRKYGLPTPFSVDLAGMTLPAFTRLGKGSMFFKQADPLITRNLKERGLLFRSGRIRHSYPFCWHCGTPLLYYAKPSWYIRTTARKEQLLASNAAINWVCDSCHETEVVGSVAELSERVRQDLSTLDLHRPFIDEVTWSCQKCPQGTLKRIPDVADAWFDSGSMTVAQWQVMDTLGADAMRWYMYASAPPYNPRNFSTELVAELQRQFLRTPWNTYSFFVTYARVDGWQPPTEGNPFTGLELP